MHPSAWNRNPAKEFASGFGKWHHTCGGKAWGPPGGSGREEGATAHVRTNNHAGGFSGEDGRRHTPYPGANPAPTPAAGRVRGVRRPRRSAERQAARRGLLGERRSVAGHGGSGG